MGMPGPLELIIILVIVVLVFGGKRLKNLGGDLGGAIKGFKKSMKDVSAEEKTEKAEDIIEVKTEKEEKTSK
jgi:sec-independent protein translocase protein TatA